MAWSKNVITDDKIRKMEELIGKRFDNKVTGRGIIVSIKKLETKKDNKMQIYYYTFYEDNPSVLAKRMYSCIEGTIKYNSILESILE
jgi:hypothetical protein